MLLILLSRLLSSLSLIPPLSLSEQGLDSVTRLQFSVWCHVFQNLASSPDLYQQEIKTKGKT